MSPIAGQFSARTIAMLESPAYRALSRAAHQVLTRIEIEHAHHGGKDNGRLPVTSAQFVEYGIHRHAIAPAIRELVALGFIEITREGRAPATPTGADLPSSGSPTATASISSLPMSGARSPKLTPMRSPKLRAEPPAIFFIVRFPSPIP